MFNTCSQNSGCAPPRAPKQHVHARAEQNVGGGKFSEVTEAGFCHERHSSYKCPQRLFDLQRVLLMLIPFGTPCTVPRRQTKRTFTKTPFMSLTSMFACDMCKTRAPKHIRKYLYVQIIIVFCFCSACRCCTCFAFF